VISEEGAAGRPVVLVVAPTGAEVTRADNPVVPYTPREIADQVIGAHAAGASVCHLHVREPDGTPSSRPELFRETIDLIGAGCDIVTMVSTGGAVGMTLPERTAGLGAGPEMAGIETGSINFGDDLFPTTPAETREIARLARERGIALEVEAFELGHVDAALRFAAAGEVPAPLRFNLVFGVPGAMAATHRNLAATAAAVPAEYPWGVTAVGRHGPRLLALGALMGATCLRTGFEDGVYLKRGALAESNAALVERLRLTCDALERPAASTAQARELLGLGAGRR
jgi:3-keto-5-aminohexanoate cleavage enzyme